tara:strand:- start:382 stop:1509 length:1128 start_codon:yes stop_codon:yes gene_type:complete
MSDENQEVLEDAEDLQEKKASMGDPSEVPEPTPAKAKPLPGSKSQGDKAPQTKMGMLNAMMKNYGEMKKADLQAAYHEMMDKMPKDDEEKAEGMHKEMAHGKKEKKEGMHKEMAHAKKENMHYGKKMKKEDIDLSDDVAALFGDEELSEEFKEKATTIFEATVVAKINEAMDDIVENIETAKRFEEDEIKEEMVEKLDGALDYVVEQWMDSNRLAIENGIRTEIAEEFMGGLKSLFEQSYIEMPEEKVDVLGELSDKVDSLEEELNKELQKNIELSQTVETLYRDSTFAEVSGGLTVAQQEKLKGLSEGVEFVSEEDFKEKLEMIKDTYFSEIEEEVQNETIFDEEEPLEEETSAPKVTGEMAQYMSAISRTVKK